MREAITAFLQEANIEYVGIVYPARPEIAPEQAYEENRLAEAVMSEGGSSSILVVNLPSDNRQRKADTGRGAVNDQITYKALIEVFFANVKGEAIQAQTDYDQTVDAIVTAIRENATLGAPGTVWSAGEYETGVEHAQGEPITDADGMTVFINGAIRFDAMSWVAGNV